MNEKVFLYHNINMYFNYHAKIKRLIDGGHLVKFEFVDRYKNISPSLVLYFDNHVPMPVREYKFETYDQILNKFQIAKDSKVLVNDYNNESE